MGRVDLSEKRERIGLELLKSDGEFKVLELELAL
jgi:hypothetical protein